MSPISVNWVKMSARSPMTSDLLQHLGEPLQLAGASGDGRAVAEELRRVVAHLLQLHQRGQHQPLALDAVRAFQRRFRLFGHRQVEGGLLLGQRAIDRHLLLLRQVGNDAAVGFQAAQQEGTGEAFQPCGRVGIVFQLDGLEEIARETLSPCPAGRG